MKLASTFVDNLNTFWWLGRILCDVLYILLWYVVLNKFLSQIYLTDFQGSPCGIILMMNSCKSFVDIYHFERAPSYHRSPKMPKICDGYWEITLVFQDRVIFHRLENVCHCVEKGEWPSMRRFFFPTPDSRSSTPVPNTPLGGGTPKPGTPINLQDYLLANAGGAEGSVSGPSGSYSHLSRAYPGLDEEGLSDESRDHVVHSQAEVCMHDGVHTHTNPLSSVCFYYLPPPSPIAITLYIFFC